VLADPPWRFATYSAKGRGRSPDGPALHPRNNHPERHYATMSLEEIKDMRVADAAGEDSVLLLWAVDPLLPQALEVGAAWGFTFKTIGFVWAKERRTTSVRGEGFEDRDSKRFPMGTGYWTRANPEVCLLFTRGAPRRVSASVRKLLIAPRREHSRKPELQYQRIEALLPGPYLELFSREDRPGWDTWGLEAGKFKRGRRG
jgi:N6-adenosine-specific RNA methylase IME4